MERFPKQMTHCTEIDINYMTGIGSFQCQFQDSVSFM